MQIADMLSKIVAQNTMVSFHWATVVDKDVSSTPKTCSVTLSGSTTVLSGLRYLHAYNPTIGDVVLVLVNDKDLIVFGHLEG